MTKLSAFGRSKLMISQSQWLRIITVAAAVHVLVGCTTPASRFHKSAAKHGLQRQTQAAALITYTKGHFVDGDPIHVYLDGDGTPTLGRGRIARDPTSRDRIILDLINADPASSILVGRPCYYGSTAKCHPSQWTTARYSAAVVKQIASAINELIPRFPNSKIILIGYSGGGTLAMLVAPALHRLDALVTIAANLDTEAWLELHGYSPLLGSLNPANEPPLSPKIRQFHFFGEHDKNVPVEVARHVIERQESALVEVVAGFGHRCCWPEIWPAHIERIGRLITTVVD